MEVILQQDFPALGYVGDRVKVKGGYARNFLIPRGIALEASVHNESLLKHKLGGINARKIKLKAQAQELAAKLEALRLEFFLRMGAAGKAYGSITVKDIEEGLKREGFIIDRRQVSLPEPIRKAGEHKVSVKLHSEVTAGLKVQVNTELPEPKPEEKSPAKAGKEGKKTRTKKGQAEQRHEGEEGARENKAKEASPKEKKKSRAGAKAHVKEAAGEGGAETGQAEQVSK